MHGVKWVAAVALGVLGAAVGIVVGIGGSSAGGQATAASVSSDPAGQLDPVLNAGTKAVLKAVDQGLALVLSGKDGKGGSSGFKTQQSGWNRVKNDYDTGETKFINTTSKASNQFLNGVLSGGDPTADLIQLLKLIGGYQQKVGSAAAGWSQVQNKTSFDLQVASAASAGAGAGAGKANVSDLKGANQLIQTVAKAEIKLYEQVAVTEIEYEGGLLDAKTAITQIDTAFAAFESAVTGGAKMVVKGSPVGWNQVVNKQVAPTVNTWNIKVDTTSLDAINSTPQTPTTTTVAQPSITVTINCPTPQGGQDGFFTGDPIVVTGSVSPAVAGGTVTMHYDSSPNEGLSNTTDTDTTASNGTFTDTTTAPTVISPSAQSIQATDGSANSNACPAELQSPG